MNKDSFQVGLNLGGWLSQYPSYDYDHFDTFIKEADFRRIADWGCDHIRLPVDYPVLEDENHPGAVNERGIGYVRRALEWSRDNGLRAILDLHKAPGFSFENLQTVSLFDSPAEQDRFINIWRTLSVSFVDTNDFVAFELLNEIFLPDSSPWNRLARNTIGHIREIDAERLIVIGGNYFNSPSQLTNLDVSTDSNILYTFHFYEPMVVTHQKAKWVPFLSDYNHEVAYPGFASDLAEFLERHPEYKAYLGHSASVFLDKSSLSAAAQPAIDFSHGKGQSVYCGEYGVIEGAPLETRLNWTADFVSILLGHHIGRAYWSYKGIDFGLVDPHGEVISDKLVKIVCAR